jgi:hypothetical protein
MVSILTKNNGVVSSFVFPSLVVLGFFCVFIFGFVLVHYLTMSQNFVVSLSFFFFHLWLVFGTSFFRPRHALGSARVFCTIKLGCSFWCLTLFSPNPFLGRFVLIFMCLSGSGFKTYPSLITMAFLASSISPIPIPNISSELGIRLLPFLLPKIISVKHFSSQYQSSC